MDRVVHDGTHLQTLGPESDLPAHDSLWAVQDEIESLPTTELTSQEAVYRIKRHRAALALPNRLPTELLRYIFQIRCAHKVNLPPMDSGDIFTISRVCFIWRQISFSTPEFWASISLSYTQTNKNTLAGIGKQWLSRAGAIPVSLDIPYSEFVKYDTHISNLYDFLSQFQFRRLCLPGKYLTVEEITGIFRRSAKTLHELELDRLHIMKEPVFFGPDDQLHSLTSLILDGNQVYGILGAVASWNHLVELSISRSMNIPMSVCLDILRQCRLIAICRIYYLELDLTSETEFHLPSISLPELHLLDLGGDGQACKIILAALTLPKLKNLCLNNRGPRLKMTTSDICDIIHCPDGMQHLEVFQIWTTEEALDLGKILACAPALRKIVIEQGVLDEAAIHLLSTGSIGRRLEEIFIKPPHNADKFLKMLETRHMNASNSLIDDAQLRITPFRSINMGYPPTADWKALQARCLKFGDLFDCLIRLSNH